MTWRPAPRRPALTRSRPNLEPLESRNLLTTLADFQNPSFDTLIHDNTVRQQYQVDGSGLAAAVIDTGIDYTDSALGGSFGPGAKVEGGYDLAMNKADPRATSWSHGTMVAGLIASSDPSASGVAPGADLVALRVFGDNNQGSFDAIANALQWVIDHHTQENITVVNLSISDGANYPSDWYSNDGGIGQRIAGLVDQLRALRIPVVTAAGNNFHGSQGMGFIAIEPGTISVTASDPSNHLLPDAQRLGPAVGGTSFTDLVAPGSNLLTTDNSGGQARVEGTSFATSLVTGSIVLLQSIYQQRFGTLPPVNDLLSWLRNGSDPIFDPSTGLTLPRLDVAKAAALIPAAPASTPAPAPAPTPALAPSIPATAIAPVTPAVAPASVPAATPPTAGAPAAIAPWTSPTSPPVSTPSATKAIAVPAATSRWAIPTSNGTVAHVVVRRSRVTTHLARTSPHAAGAIPTTAARHPVRHTGGKAGSATFHFTHAGVAKPHGKLAGRTLAGSRVS